MIRNGIARGIIATTILAALSCTNASAETFLCQPKSVKNIMDASGKTAPHALENLKIQISTEPWHINVTNNAVAARVRVQNSFGTSWNYSLQQVGGSANDFVATRVYEGPASTPVYVIRVRTWDKGIIFSAVESDVLTTGTCTQVR